MQEYRRSERIAQSSGCRSPVRAILAATGTAIAATILQSSQRPRIDERLEIRARQIASVATAQESPAASEEFSNLMDEPRLNLDSSMKKSRAAIATWNVRTLVEDIAGEIGKTDFLGKVPVLDLLLKQAGLDIVAMQETRINDIVDCKFNNFKFYFSGRKGKKIKWCWLLSQFRT